jgi:hypothetical protein
MLSLLAVVSACSGSRDTAAPARPPADAAPRPVPVTAPEPVPPEPDPAPQLEALAVDGGDEAETLRRLGAVPAWQAVVERGQHLARRGQQGVVFGRVGAPVTDTPQRWLIDETEGEGALAIRLGFDPRLVVEEGMRVAAWGAWHLDPQQRWYWQAERMALLSAAGSQPFAVAPGLVIPAIERAPETAVPVSQLATDGEILFEIRGTPRDPTDGWEIRDPGDLRAVARLVLPGDQPSYGSQDYRGPDEHWRLAPGTLYTVVVRRQRNVRADALPVLYARGIPRQVTTPPRRALRTGALLEAAQQRAEQSP